MFEHSTDHVDGETNPDYDQIAGAHELLASYPFASATPTSHTARHLGPLSLTTPMPSLGQPHLIPPIHSAVTEAFLHGNVPADIQSRHVWEQHRDAIIRSLNGEAQKIRTSRQTPSYREPTTRLNPETQWAPSSHHVSPLSDSVLRSVAHHPVRPSLPPNLAPIQTSLSNALGIHAPVVNEDSSLPNQTFGPESSSAFFNDFLSTTLRQIEMAQAQTRPPEQNPGHGSNSVPSQHNTYSSSPYPRVSTSPTAVGYSPSPAPSPISTQAASQVSQIQPSHRPQQLTPRRTAYVSVPMPPPTPSRQKPQVPEESPDPLALRSGQTAAYLNVANSTPSRKRKLGEQHHGVVRMASKGGLSSATDARPRSVISDTSHNDADATAYDYGDETDSEYGYTDADGDVDMSGDTPSTIATRGRKRSRLHVDRDDRIPLQKLTTLIEEIFEAEDSLAPDEDASLTQLPASFSAFFSPLTTDATRPLLNSSLIARLEQFVRQVARPPKRSRRQNMSSPSKPLQGDKGEIEPMSLSEIDPATLGRLLKLLERSVTLGEDIAPFAGPAVSEVPGYTATSGSPSKKSKKSKTTKSSAPSETVTRRSRSRSRSRSRNDEDNAEGGFEPHGKKGQVVTNDAEGRVGTEPNEDDLERLGTILATAHDSVAAASCAVSLLAADSLPKQLYSEELILACVSAIKNQLSNIIYPFAEGLGDIYGHNSAILEFTLHSSSSASQAHRRQIGAIFQALSAAIPHIDALVRRSSPTLYSSKTTVITMSDAIVIQIVYIAIGPFFVVEGSTVKAGGKDKTNTVLAALGGSAALRGLRLASLSLIRSVFEANPEQRSWIIDEILTSLIKLPDLKQRAGQFRLRDGRSIHTVTALILQLVQTSAHDTAIQAREFSKKRRELAVQSSGASRKVQDQTMIDLDREEMKLYSSALDGPYNIGRTIFIFLTSRAGRGKGTKTTNETEYRAILDTLLSDLLTVLYWPEWPGAALLLVVASKLLGKALEDVKTSAAATTDNNGIRAIALDHLGTIAARLRASQLRNVKSETDPVLGLPPLDVIMTNSDLQSLETLIAAHEEIATHLNKFSAEDVSINETAREMATTVWAHEISLSLTRSETALSNMIENGLEQSKEYLTLTGAVSRLRAALRQIWKSQSNDVFTAESATKRIDIVSEIISVSQVLKNAFEPTLNIIINCLDASAVFMRTKGLRALGEVILEDSAILRNSNVRRAIDNHLQDNSPAVRDAAVDLIGKYIISMPHLADDYYQQIAERIADTGLGVRKRVVKLFRSIYGVDASSDRKIDMCTRLVMRMLDEDDTVKDLACKTIGELWFPPEPSIKSDRSLANGDAAHEAFNAKVSVILGVVAKFPDRQSPLEDLLHQLAFTSDGEQVPSVLSQYEAVCDALIETLVDSSNTPGSTVINGIKSIHVFATAHPGVITSSKALTLLPYLKNPSNLEEQTISDYLLKIYRLCIPNMPKTALKFGQELQSTLQPMVIKPSTAGGVTALQETVATLCAVVKHLTHNFPPLVGLLKSCNGRLQGVIQQATRGPLPPATLTTVLLLIYITSLLCEHCDFDSLRESDPALAKTLDTITKHRINEHVYNSLLTLHAHVEDANTRSRVMQCLGFLFRSYPVLMTNENSAELMDSVFASPDLDLRARLLRIIQDFLMSESSKFMAQEKGTAKTKSNKKTVNMEELVGNTTGFAESGVSSAIVQRYFPQILECCVINHPAVQSSAIDILGFVVRQGLAHPIQCVPAIIALETSPSHSISSKALSYHMLLYNKHSTMINARHLECARKSFEYQQRLDVAVLGYRTAPTYSAQLNGWYSLVREKRSTRQDFLKALVKALDIEVSPASMTQSSLDFTRYMVENFAALEYKTQEEVLTVIRHTTSVLSVAGVHMIDTIQKSIVQHDASAPPQPNSDSAVTPVEFSRACTGIAMLLALKSHLKTMYGLTEDKCSKWVPGKKSTFGDKAAVRRREVPITWDRVPFAVEPIVDLAQQEEQHEQLLALWEEEGVSPEPVDDVE